LPIEGRTLKVSLESNELTVDSFRSLYVTVDHGRERSISIERKENIDVLLKSHLIIEIVSTNRGHGG